MQAGRTFGKTRVGSENVIDYALEHQHARIAVIGATTRDVRSVMFEGEAGLMACLPAEMDKFYNSSLSELTFPNGSLISGFSAQEPSRLRGPQHHFGWCDELAAWSYPETWDQFQMGLRLGTDPRAIVTTTPRPTKIMRELIADPHTHVTRGSSYENRGNVADKWFDAIVRKYEGTRLGRQELMAELLDDVPGALWQRAMFERSRLHIAKVPPLVRVVVAVDPAVTAGEDSDETGIIVAGVDHAGLCYVLQDASGRFTSLEWALRVVTLARYWSADRVVAEVNNGGDLVENVLRSQGGNGLPYRAVRASRGKAIRAEPAAALYEQNRVAHVYGQSPPIELQPWDALEDQCCQFVPGITDASPDRMDALVWALYDLVVDPAQLSYLQVYDWSGSQISPI